MRDLSINDRFESRLDAEVAANVLASPVRDLTDISAARRAAAALLAAAGTFALSPGVEVEDHRVPGTRTRVRIYRPEGVVAALPALVWIHGGGYVMGSVEQDDLRASRIARELTCVVASVDWDPAPENPFPDQFDQCFDALSWVQRAAGELGVDPARVAVGGASSGGGTAAALAQKAAATGEVALVGQLLLYPMLDHRGRTRSSQLDHPRVWNRSVNQVAWRAYLGDAIAEPPRFAVPALTEDLGGLPPAMLAVGELDLFRDETVEYARRLMERGVGVDLHVYRGAPHSFDAIAPRATVSERLHADCTANLGAWFGGDRPSIASTTTDRNDG